MAISYFRRPADEYEATDRLYAMKDLNQVSGTGTLVGQVNTRRRHISSSYEYPLDPAQTGGNDRSVFGSRLQTGTARPQHSSWRGYDEDWMKDTGVPIDGTSEYSLGKSQRPQQGRLFKPTGLGDFPATIDQMWVRKDSRSVAGPLVGMAVNYSARQFGDVPVPDSSLSPHSARMASRLTGQEHEVTNDLDFSEDDNQQFGYYDDKEPVSQEEVDQGRRLMRDTVKTMRPRKPQGKQLSFDF